MYPSSRWLLFCILFFISSIASAQNAYELRNLTEQEWMDLPTDARLRALNTSNNHSLNQPFVGSFSRYDDLYAKWGYDYYEMKDNYENYSFRGFENYNIVEDRRNKWYYNQFGDRLTRMTSAYSIWNDTVNDNGTSENNNPNGYVNSAIGSDGIWVLTESTKDWTLSAIASPVIRAKLTPLTMSIPNMNGFKADFQSANYQASILSSQVVSLGEDRIHGYVMLRGGQIKRKFGALTLGANYSNMYNQIFTRDGGTNFKGTVDDYTPTPIYYAVRVVDDSPQNGNGPEIISVMLKVDGVSRPDIKPFVLLDNLDRELITAVDSKTQQNYLDYSSAFYGEALTFDQLTTDERSPKYLDYLYMKEYLQGNNTKALTDNFSLDLAKSYYKVVDSGKSPLKVNGKQYAVYIFDLGKIGTKVKRVQAEVTVSGDYRIQTSQIFTKKVTGGHDAVGENMTHYSAEYWRTMAQADGNPKDGSNLRTVTVDFGYEVGNTIYGFDAQFNYLGLKMTGEYVTNVHYYMFADDVPGTGMPQNEPQDITKRKGHRSSQTDNAYYFTLQKDYNKFGLAGEVFKMGKYYRPYMNVFLAGDRSGQYLNVNDRNNTLRMTMIEDNDDNDQYPDTQFKSKAMSYGLQSLDDPDGVFPGNDLNHDGIPDNDKNFNNTPDYNEPFLMFDVDPDEFVFGDDYNNNSIPDFREDDMKYDTPYDLNRMGHHFYLRYSPSENINFYSGSMRTKSVAFDERTFDDYLKASFKYDFLAVGNFYAEYRFEKIKDNIQDKYVVVPLERIEKRGPWYRYSFYNRDLYYDEVEYKNSNVNKVFLESRLRAIPSVTIENHLKYEINDQIEGSLYDETFQPADKLTTLALVNKVAYSKQFRNFVFSPGIKFRLYKKGRSESLNPLSHYYMRIPLIYVKYIVSPKTDIIFGSEGFKGLELAYKDFIVDRNNFKRVTYSVQISNRTNYFGFEVWGGIGYKLDDLKFDKPHRSFENYKESSFFVQMWCGY